MVECDSGCCALVDEFEPGDRIYAGAPVPDPPRLNNAFVWYKFNMAACDVAAEKREDASGLAADLRRFFCEPQRLHCAAQLDNPVELSLIHQCGVDAFAAGLN